MDSPQTDSWYEVNQRHLTASLASVRALLESCLPDGEREGVGPAEPVDRAEEALPAPTALENLVAAFDLSSFERGLLLLCAGVELDSRFADLCAVLHGDPQRRYASFSLALGLLPEAHWSALSPNAPLRHWRLLELGPGEALTASPLRIDERILHYLTGVPCQDERLRALIEPLFPPDVLPPSHQGIVARIQTRWSEQSSEPPVVQLCGPESAAKRAIAAAACGGLGLGLYCLAAAEIPTDAGERDTLLRLWAREVVLSGCALLLEVDDLEGPERQRLVRAFLGQANGMLLLSRHDALSLGEQSSLRVDVDLPDTGEQRAMWEHALGPLANKLNGQLDAMISQFRLDSVAIRSATVEALAFADEGNGQAEQLDTALWTACRSQARPRLEDLAQRIEPAATWEDLVLPEPQKAVLAGIAAHLRQRIRVYEEWGFAKRSPRGLGISALFSGPSGTGKTMAAEVLADALRLDLFRIDLSTVVSKYIGETEKNLRRVFDAAEQGGAILLFDEADALFGKRSEVKDSHDRYANIEISYLLQRMEAYRGLAILTTNLKDAIDLAFLRRIRFVVQFPFPDAAQRAEIWRRIFPEQTPTEGLDYQKLARLNVPGGNIRNIALNAAFLAADRDQPVRMGHLKQATQTEYTKLERPLSSGETGGWV